MHDDHSHGLEADLARLRALALGRRRTLAWLAGVGTLPLLPGFGCGGGGGSAATTTGSATAAATTAVTSAATTTSTSTTTTSGSCAVTNEETAGPFPADGSNTANGRVVDALALSGIVRSDIRSSFAGATGTAAGVPLTVTLTLVDTAASCADLSGYAVYIWHCDRDGGYSLYAQNLTAQNYLRGVQVTGGDGTVTFQTIFPACYSGRMPHIHVEVYRNANTATAYSNALKTTQIAFPEATCIAVYGTADGYSASVANFSMASFATDLVFSDGTATEMATVGGSVASGYTAALTIGLAG